METIQNTYSEEEKRAVKAKTAKSLMWMGIVSMVMLFAGLTSAYVVSKGTDPTKWFQFEFPVMFWVSSAVIAISSLTMWLTVKAAKDDSQRGIKMWITITLMLGIVFCFTQYLAWLELIDQKVYYSFSGNMAGQYLYFISFLHVVHVISGILALTFTSVKALLGKYNSKEIIGLQVVSTFWHFLDILWVYLCFFMFFVR